jgi:UDP-GlcNAc:undecaprenyl-phosphate GlcNAc-1-phosphate transferase
VSAWIVFGLVALIATLSVTELVRVLAHRMRAVDSPGGRRVHRRPTARLGGLGIYWGFYFALSIAGFLPRLDVTADQGLIGVLIGSSLLLVVGMLDDIRGVPALSKLAFQMLAAVVLYQWGWRVEHLGLPGLGSWTVGVLSLPLTVVWVVAVTNAFNLIDGLDGLAAGIALVAAVAICALAAPGHPIVTLLAAALIGALAGFMWFNLSPALIFMGDAGSLFVGFVVAALTLRAGTLGPDGTFPLVPALVVAVPLLDTGIAILRRARGPRPKSMSGLAFVRDALRRVFVPDGQHVHHRLILAGLSTRQAVAALWLLALAFAAAGVTLARTPAVGLAALAVAVAMTAWGARRVHLRLDQARPHPVSDSLPDGLRPDVAWLTGEPALAPETSEESDDEEHRAA